MQIDMISSILGFATIVSWILSMWLFFDSRRVSSIEAEKKRALAERIEDLASMADSVAMQVNLVIEVSRREETSKDELRHLAVSIQYSLLNLRSQSLRELSHLKEWTMGSPSSYLSTPKSLIETRDDVHEETANQEAESSYGE